LINSGIKWFTAIIKRSHFNEEFYTIIEEKLRSLCFSCNDFNICLPIREQLKFKTVKELIIDKMQLKDIRFKFLLSEAIYDDKNLIKEISVNIDLVRMSFFQS
jgi:hypothetical protein